MAVDTRPAIFVTGGTGFFGRALLQHWLEQANLGHAVPSVVIGARSPAAFLKQFPQYAHCPWLDFHQSDILRPETLPTGASFTHVLHAATDSTLGTALVPLQRYDQIVDGTRHLLDFAIRCGAKRFLLTSSGAVYGPQAPSRPYLEESCLSCPDPMQHTNAYGMGKLTAEHLCALYHQAHGLETVVARCFAFVGPDLPLDVHFAIGNFIRDALYADSITVQGDGSPLRSYMDQRDLAQWLVTLLIDGKAGQAYNVGSDHAVSILELAHTVRDLLAPHKPLRVLSPPNTSTPRSRYIPSIDKAKTELGLSVTIPLDEAIRFAACAHSAGNPK
jgi:UDP-glucuronate decarboxylase